MDGEINHLTADIISQRLKNAIIPDPELPFPPGFLQTSLRPAAVMIPLLLEYGEWRLLFIRRADNHYDPHSSQVAFPGGGVDASDADAMATALREMYEEIGIRSDHVKILGALPDFVTITGYKVSPVIGQIPWPYPIKLASSEVSRVFTIPLTWLANPENREDRVRNLPPPFEPVKVIYYKPYQGEVLWGASARFTQGLLEALGISQG